MNETHWKWTVMSIFSRFMVLISVWIVFHQDATFTSALIGCLVAAAFWLHISQEKRT